MEKYNDPPPDLKILLNKEYLCREYLRMVKDAKTSKRNLFRTASKTGIAAKFGRVGILENRHNKKKGKWGKPK